MRMTPLMNKHWKNCGCLISVFQNAKETQLSVSTFDVGSVFRKQIPFCTSPALRLCHDQSHSIALCAYYLIIGLSIDMGLFDKRSLSSLVAAPASESIILKSVREQRQYSWCASKYSIIDVYGC